MQGLMLIHTHLHLYPCILHTFRAFLRNDLPCIIRDSRNYRAPADLNFETEHGEHRNVPIEHQTVFLGGEKDGCNLHSE